jgi:predicted dienelactone hydrolase
MNTQFLKYPISILFSLAIIFSSAVFAQQYQVGHIQKTFIDQARANRNIPVEIYYPSTFAGNNVSVASGQFPVIVFGHGFSMSWSAYQYFWDSIVPYGYIVALPTTEGSFSPSHTDFAKDMAFVISAMKTEGLNNSSDFFGAIDGTSALMGHSMGGGCAFLAQQYDTTVTAISTFAGAVTTPSSVTAAQSIHKPSLIFAGANDCVAPPVQHQLPMYDSLASLCKTYVSIDGASHCQFADINTICYFGEGTCTPQATITEADQQNELIALLLPWLNFYLKGDCQSGGTFQSVLSASAGISFQQNCTVNCTTTGIMNRSKESNVVVYPNPFSVETTVFVGDRLNNSIVLIKDVFGKQVFKGSLAFETEFKIDRKSISSGLYVLQIVQNGKMVASKKIVIID